MTERIGLIGDSHRDADFMRRALRQLAEQDVRLAVQLGDFGYWPHEDNKFAETVSSCAQTHGMEVWFLDGNHEHHALLRHDAEKAGWDGTASNKVRLLPGLFWLPRGHHWTIGDTKFVAVGGAYSIDNPGRNENIDWFPRHELLSYGEISEACDAPGCDVLLCHDVPDFGGRKPPGAISNLPERHEHASLVHRKHLRVIVDRHLPWLVVHGHWHHRYARQRPGEPRIEGLADNRRPDEACVILELPKLRLEAVRVGAPPPPKAAYYKQISDLYEQLGDVPLWWARGFGTRK